MYKDTEDFIKAKATFDTLAAKVESVSNLIKAAGDNKLPLYNQLIINLVKFDDHLKKMIKDFPEYYNDCKEAIDNMFVQNTSFLEATFLQMKALNPVEN